MTRRIVIIGCGGFGREVFGILQAQRAQGTDWQVEGFLDDAASESNLELVAELGSRVIGPVEELAGMGDISAVIAVGAPALRAAISKDLAAVPITWPVLIHPDTTIGTNVTIDEGAVVAAGARLSTNIIVGAHAHIDQNATVGHDVVIGAFARLNPQACISGSVTVGRGAVVGANAAVLPSVRIGSGAIVGAGGCVVEDVPNNTKVKGVPAR